MNTTLKIGSTILVAGSIATGIGFGVQGSLSKTNTNEEIKKEAKKDSPEPEVPKVRANSLIDQKFRLLEQKEEDQDKWDQKWNKFREDYADKIPDNINSFWNFVDWNLTKETKNTPIEFKNKCTKSNDQNVEGVEDPLFVVFRDYCLIEKEEA